MTGLSSEFIRDDLDWEIQDTLLARVYEVKGRLYEALKAIEAAREDYECFICGKDDPDSPGHADDCIVGNALRKVSDG